MDVERVLRGVPSTVTMTFYNGSTAVDADGAVNVTVKRADGTTLTTGSASGPVSHVYSFVIPAQTNLNVLTVTWSAAISTQAVTVYSTVEIVGGFIFSISELRGYDAALGASRFTDTQLVEERLSVESDFEDITGRSFTPRFWREDYVEIADGYLVLEKPEAKVITKFTVDGVDQLSWITSKYVTYDKFDPRVLNLTTSALSALYATQIQIEYEYGMTTVPRKIRDAALKLARYNLLGLNSAVDERALTLTTPESGTMTLATPGRSGFETGIPEVDRVLHRYTIGATGSAGVF